MSRMFDPTKPTKLGTELSTEQQRKALACYVHRFTRDHKPAWARETWKDGRPYPVQFASDREWLANTRFNVKRDGSLADADCESAPTWPDTNGVRPQ